MAIAFGAIIENAFGGLGNDTLVGSGGANRLVGNAGNDTLDGGLGNDTIDGGSGADSMNGGDGVDTLSYASSGAGILFYLLAANLNGGDGNDTLNDQGVAELAFSIGGNGNDTIIGTNGQDQMWGGTGAIDTGADVFQFGAGNGYDIIFDFQAGAGVVDQISLIGFDLSNSGQMLSANLISQAGANTQINLPGSGNVIFLINTTATTLVADDVPLG
jgi:Ca2+-binding RTX toxin-like protein